jgi:CheY-like chemotaxis protein
MSKTKVLLVEDDKTISALYVLKLKLSDYDVKVAENGQEALETLKSFKPAVILLDLLMPIMNGEEFLVKLRADEKLADLSVVVLTNLNLEEAPKSLWKLGISDYYVKAQSTPAELIDIIEKTLKNKQ